MLLQVKVKRCLEALNLSTKELLKCVDGGGVNKDNERVVCLLKSGGG